MQWILFVLVWPLVSTSPSTILIFRDIYAIVTEKISDSQRLQGGKRKAFWLIVMNVLAILLTVGFSMASSCSASKIAEEKERIESQKTAIVNEYKGSISETSVDLRDMKLLLLETRTAVNEGASPEPSLIQLESKIEALSKKIGEVNQVLDGHEKTFPYKQARVRVTPPLVACYRDEIQSKSPVCYVSKGSGGKIDIVSRDKNSCRVIWDDQSKEPSWIATSDLRAESVEESD